MNLYKSYIGVSSVEANVEEKRVTVTSEGVDKQFMLDKLLKWSEASGKSVDLAPCCK